MVTREEITKQFVDLMEKERVNLGLTQEQMAKKLEMSTSGYKKITAGETKKIDIFLVYQLGNLLGKNVTNLFEDDSVRGKLARKLDNLSDSQMHFLNSIVDFEIEFAPGKAEGKETLITVLEPVGDVMDGMVWNTVQLSILDISQYKKRLGDEISCGIKMNNNHLHPAFLKDDILLISREALRDGDIGIFVNKENGRAYIRKYRQTQPACLEPINNYGETFYVDSHDPKSMEKWIKFGKVLTKIR